MYLFANESILDHEDVNSIDLELDDVFGDDLQLVMESITQVNEEIDGMFRQVAVLEAAKSSTSVTDRRSVLKAAQLHRESLTRYYNYEDSIFTKVVAVESVSNENLVFALEEEAEAQKGIISRMIDAVKKAFVWLWEKITSIFKSTEKPEDSKKAAEDLMKRLEDAIAKKDEIPPNTVISDDKFGRPFAGLGETIDIPKVLASLDVQKTGGEIIKGLVTDITDHLSKAKDMVDKMGSGGKDPMEVYTEFCNNVIGSISKHIKDNLKPEQVDLYKFAAAGENIAPAKSYITQEYVASEGPSAFCIYWSTGKTNKGGKFKAGFRVRGGLTKTATITLPGKLSDLKTLVEKMAEVSNTQSAQFEEAQKLNPEGKAKEFQRDLDAVKEKLGKDNAGAQASLKLFIDYANGVGAVMTGTIQFLKALDTSSKIYRSLVEAAIKAAGGETGANETKEPAKEGDKPAEAAKEETVVQQGAKEETVVQQAAPTSEPAAKNTTSKKKKA